MRLRGVGAASGSVHLIVSPGPWAAVTLMVGLVLPSLRLAARPCAGNAPVSDRVVRAPHCLPCLEKLRLAP
ncbi:hypothetical protein HMPREF1549_00294 [Actinomyces johnsonii F0510]|uniref:Uncharacterized protein n=1 Tax=Actinomyces johnsonii F0510 TaxID=1227262 RepID=U1Q210_9ACTO|nr:hypothetical protein HMPREF1549_00294 [Actinomyces johnsonii F0510]